MVRPERFELPTYRFITRNRTSSQRENTRATHAIKTGSLKTAFEREQNYQRRIGLAVGEFKITVRLPQTASNRE